MQSAEKMVCIPRVKSANTTVLFIFTNATQNGITNCYVFLNESFNVTARVELVNELDKVNTSVSTAGI